MQAKIDTLPYKTFLKLKEKYPAANILVTDSDVTQPGLGLMYKDHREYITRLFQKKGIEVSRFAHNYGSLSTKNPELGLVFLANDSVVIPGIEVWCLIGHNARYVNEIGSGKTNSNH